MSMGAKPIYMLRQVTGASVLQDLAGDDQPLNFAGAFADGAELDVAVKLLSGIILDKSVAAVNLHSFVGALHRDLAGIQFGHGRLQRGLHAGIFHRAASISDARSASLNAIAWNS